MKIAIISKSDRNGGGASRVAEDLAIWLNDSGHPTDHFVAFNYKEPLSFQRHLYGGGRRAKLCHEIQMKTKYHGFPELLPVEYWLNFGRFLNNYDIVHFHDLHTAISPLTLALTSLRKPTFFTIHDCSAFTGGCLYPMECQKFTSYCHQCPQLPADSRDRTKEIQAIKRWVAKQFNICYVFPSRWMLQEAQQALKFKISPVVIPNSLDLELFPCAKKTEVKISLDIAENRKVIAISAHVLNDPRKGVTYAVEAIRSVRDLSPLVLVVGICNEELRQVLQGIEFKEMGYISNPKLLAHVYSAADVMLFCTLADNLPLTVMEAMAASTPVVGFSTGGVPEMIQTGRNGILVEPTNQQALNQAVRQALLSNDLEIMGQHARRDIENNFSKTVFVEKHLQLYQDFERSLSKKKVKSSNVSTEAAVTR